MVGTLHLCATPIGNLKDITFRVFRTLKEADLIAVEDTRHSIKLLNRLNIRTPTASYHEYNKVDKAGYLMGRLEERVDIILITDADAPGISDPGEELVRQCYKAEIQVTSLLDPAACITAFTVSGLSTKRFCFGAFLPSEKGDREERTKVLEELKREIRATIVCGAPHHLARTLEDLYKALGDRNITIHGELTKKYGTACRAMFRESLECYRQEEPRGECVIVIEGEPLEELRGEQISRWEDMEIQEHLACYTDQGMDKKGVMKTMIRDRGITRRDVHQKFL